MSIPVIFAGFVNDNVNADELTPVRFCWPRMLKVVVEAEFEPTQNRILLLSCSIASKRVPTGTINPVAAVESIVATGVEAGLAEMVAVSEIKAFSYPAPPEVTT